MSDSGSAYFHIKKANPACTDLEFSDDVQDFLNAISLRHKVTIDKSGRYEIFYDRCWHFDVNDFNEILSSCGNLKLELTYIINGDGTDEVLEYEITSNYVREVSTEDDDLENLSEL